MAIKDHGKITGFSGNEIFCLEKLGYRPGQLCLGNNVLSLGVGRGIGAGLSNLAGGEVTEITKLVYDGRKNAYDRMMKEAAHYGGVGLAGVTFDLINHGSNIEFLAFGSTVTDPNHAGSTMSFSSFADAQQLYCQIDAGFTPKSFVSGNVAYSIGVGGNIAGAFRGLKRGEVPQYTEIFDRTRHLALSRIKDAAKEAGANAVIGIQTSIMPLMGAQEMLMLGTAASHPSLQNYTNDPVTSDMTNEELWNMINIGYMPITLVMGVSVYSLGLASGISSFAKTLVGGEVTTLSELLYEAREKAFERLQAAATKCNADEVIGVKTRVYDMGGGLVEIMAIGTAVKRVPGLTTKQQILPAQAIIQDRETFVEASRGDMVAQMATASNARRSQAGPMKIIGFIILIIFYALIAMSKHH